MTDLYLTLVVAISGFICINAMEQDNRRIVYIAKPLTTLLIITLAVLNANRGGNWGGTSIAILVGLVFSVGGDIFLMLPNDQFMPGMACFAAAQISYIVGFSWGQAFWGLPLLLVALLVYGVYIYSMLAEKLDSLRIPIIIYITLILVMAWRAILYASNTDMAGAWTAGLGALFFVASDSLLALNRFSKPIHHHPTWVLTTYYVAQWLIAISL